jgi:hypothetical protein
MSATRPRKEQYGGVLAAVKANPTGGLRPALTPAPGTTPPTAIRGQQETRSLQLKSPRNQGNPGSAAGELGGSGRLETVTGGPVRCMNRM